MTARFPGGTDSPHASTTVPGEALMAVRVAVDFPEDAFSALRTTPEDFVRARRQAAAIAVVPRQALLVPKRQQAAVVRDVAVKVSVRASAQAAWYARHPRGSPDCETTL